MSRRFARRGDGLALTLSVPELELLRDWLPGQLRAVYDTDDSGDAARARLFPRAYLDPTEERAEEEWQELVYPELLRARLEALARVEAVLSSPQRTKRSAVVVDLGPDDVPALLGVLNDIRLALGTVLDVQEDTDLDRLDPGGQSTQGYVVYVWLTHLEGELVDALLGEPPE